MNGKILKNWLNKEKRLQITLKTTFSHGFNMIHRNAAVNHIKVDIFRLDFRFLFKLNKTVISTFYTKNYLVFCFLLFVHSIAWFNNLFFRLFHCFPYYHEIEIKE